MLLKLCAIFAAGLLTDFLMVRYTRAITEKKPFFAASVSALMTVGNLTLIGFILSEWMESSGLVPIAAFAGGSWLGTYFTVRQR